MQAIHICEVLFFPSTERKWWCVSIGNPKVQPRNGGGSVQYSFLPLCNNHPCNCFGTHDSDWGPHSSLISARSQNRPFESKFKKLELQQVSCTFVSHGCQKAKERSCPKAPAASEGISHTLWLPGASDRAPRPSSLQAGTLGLRKYLLLSCL